MKKMTKEEILNLDLSDLHVKRSSKEAFEETGISLEDVLADQDQEEPNFIEDDIKLEEPLTYSRKD